MHIGIDFDNTIVCYDALFHKVACERSLIPDNLAPNKLAVRNYLRAEGLEDRWTEMQGYVYGTRMDEAVAYDGAIDFVEQMIAIGHTVSIVSHKTRHPLMGPSYDLHAAARSWIDSHLACRLPKISAPLQAYFELTKKDKLSRIAQSGCDAFIDDLPEILLAEDFPPATQRLLFDPEAHHQVSTRGLQSFNSWRQLALYFEQS